MAKIIWIPGLGNTTTFDEAPIPPGGHLVSPPVVLSSHQLSGQQLNGVGLPVSAIPSATTQPVVLPTSASGTPPSSADRGTGSFGGFIMPSLAPSPGTMQAAVTQSDARTLRAQEKSRNTAWANDPTIRSMEERSWDIYVETGRWDTPEQIALHKQAEDYRKALNPLYHGSGPGGPITQGDENKISLPNVAPDPALGKIVTIGALGIGAIVLLAMMKG